MRVTIWNENLHEKRQEEVRLLYPDGIHGCIRQFLEKNEDLEIRTATFEEPEHGLTQKVLDETDVLIYWSHMAQEDFSDEVAERIHQAVLQGMGLVALHSAHYSKMMKRLLGTSMTLRWRHGDRERLFVTCPSHPIARGLPDYFELPVEEMYGEYFDIPKPDDVVFTGWFAGGEVFRSGCTFQRGLGKIFYFQPGHEQYPTYHDPYIQQVITNAVYWCAPVRRAPKPLDCTEVKEPLEADGDRSRTNGDGEKWLASRRGQEKSRKSPSPVALSIFYEHLREGCKQRGISFREALAMARDCGIRGIEMEYATLEQQPELLEAIRAAGLEISNLYQFFDFGKDYAGGLELGSRMIRQAVSWGVKRVMIIPGFLTQEQADRLNRLCGDFEKTACFLETLPETRAMRDALRVLVEQAAESDIFVSMEDFDSYDSPIARINELKWFLEQVPGLQHTLDCGNYVFSDENVKEAYEILKERIGHVHCKDRGTEAETAEALSGLMLLPGEEPGYRRGLRPVPVGEGYLPIAELVQKLLADGYTGYLAIEHFGAEDQIGYMRKSAAFLHEVIRNLIS